MDEFSNEVALRLLQNESNRKLHDSAHIFMLNAVEQKYSYNFSWLGRPIIQMPQDIVAMQNIIWTVKPDLIIETGIAHGGSLVFSASMLALLDYIDTLEDGEKMTPLKPKRCVLGLDIDIRKHNRVALERHPMFNRISMIEGSSIDPTVISQVYDFAKDKANILVCLDSNHTHEHVLAELNAYAPLVGIGSYCVVFDTFDIPKKFLMDRPWGPGNNAGTATIEFLSANSNFVIDRDIDNMLILSSSPNGYLKRVS